MSGKFEEQGIAILGEPAKPVNGLEKFIGPGATRPEIILQFGAALVASVAAIVYPLSAGFSWTWWQYAIVGALALDMAGGILTNATNSGKSWYHRASQTNARHLIFIAIHIFQIGLVYGFFAPNLWRQGVYLYAVLIILSIVILATPRYLQRPVSLLCYIGAIMFYLYAITPVEGMEWFVPAFFLKLLVSHLPYEICFRPTR